MNEEHKSRKRAGGSHTFIYLCSLLFVLCFFLPYTSGAEELVEVKGLRHWTTDESTRVVIDLSGPADFTKDILSNPDRLFFDLKNAKVSKDLQKNFEINSQVLKSVRVGQFNATTVRAVFDLETNTYDFKVLNLEDPARLVIDILTKSAAAKKPAPRQDPKPAPKPAPKPEMKPETRPDMNTEARLMQRRVVIDPGHGGHDPGAVGPNGLYEKDVVLDIALRARSILRKEYPHYEVVLTRETDVFIPLPKRAALANRINADFFLSVHANASPNRQARGIETYLLNWTNDEQALRVAARENDISLKKMKEVQSELGIILASLERESKRDDSVKLAGFIQKALVAEMRPHYPRVHDLGVKQALFYVLVDAKMPSALAEVAFISNPEEEQLLADESYRQQVARSLVSGINAYFNTAPQPRMASREFREKAASRKVSPPSGAYKVKKVAYTRKVR
jgi:N-acetylmuramoyl-L-alanine amidase